MIHFGDITKINGALVPETFLLCGGSPCQDLSMAGKRAGLGGERSGLYMEQIRLVKEMREQYGRVHPDRYVRYPRFMLWENVAGVFSSGKDEQDRSGEDFRIVLEEAARVKDSTANIPMPEKWADAGLIVGDGFSIAWRVVDGQFYGVPQRRRRICMVCDFDGLAAGDVVFGKRASEERRSEVLSVGAGLSGSDKQSESEGQVGEDGRAAEEGADKAGAIVFQERAGKAGG